MKQFSVIDLYVFSFVSSFGCDTIFDLHVFELLTFAVHTSLRSQLSIMKALYIHKSSRVFTRSVCSDMFHVPEVRTESSCQSIRYRGTRLLTHLLKSKMLPRHYESIGENETKSLFRKFNIEKKINCERLGYVVFC